MTPELQEKAEKILGHTFNNRDLLKESLTHASIADNRLDSNERLEFLGDAVLDLIICEALYRKFPSYQEGELTKIKSAVVSRRTRGQRVMGATKDTPSIVLLTLLNHAGSLPSHRSEPCRPLVSYRR